MTPLKLVEIIEGPRPLPGTPQLLHLRTFRTKRSVREHRLTFLPIAEALNSTATRETLSSGNSFEDVSGGNLGSYALVVNVAGEFYTIDEMMVKQASVGTTETAVWLVGVPGADFDRERKSVLVAKFQNAIERTSSTVSSKIRLQFRASVEFSLNAEI